MFSSMPLLFLYCICNSFAFAQMPWERNLSVAPPPPPMEGSSIKNRKHYQELESAWNWAIPHLPLLRDLSISQSENIFSLFRGLNTEWATRIVIKKAFKPELILLLIKSSAGDISIRYAQFVEQSIHDQAIHQKLANPKLLKPDICKMKYVNGIIKDSNNIWLKEEVSRFEKMSIQLVDRTKLPLDADVFELAFFSRESNEFAYRCHDLKGSQEITLWVNGLANRVLDITNKSGSTSQ